MKSQLLNPLLVLIALATSAMAGPFNVRDFGAKGDKSANDASAIQAAIDACNQAGGGEVLVPAGEYLTGRISLKSNVTLNLTAGATIWASGKADDYAPNPPPQGDWFLFVADGQENIAIAGDGSIHGVGQDDLDRRGETEGQPLPPHRFGLVRFSNCRYVHLRQVRMFYSDWHTVVLFRCEKVFVDGVAIINNFYHTNADGIDPESCKDVFISNCYIIAGDDCICPKTEKGYPLDNLVVQNCILESVAAAIKLGTGSTADFRDIKVSNCVIRNSGVGLGIFIKDGGTAERISFANISIETTAPDAPINSRLRNNIIPIYIDIEQRTASSPIGAVRDVSFSDIQIVSDQGILIQGMPERPIENLTLRNISFRVNHAFDFSQRTKRAGGRGNPKDTRITKFVRQPTYIALAHINGLVLDTIRVSIDDAAFKAFDRSAVAIFESRNAVVKDVQRQPGGTKAGQPVMTMSNCQEMLVANCLVPPGTPAFLGLAGEKTKGITLAGNALGKDTKAVVRAKEVPTGAVKF